LHGSTGAVQKLFIENDQRNQDARIKKECRAVKRRAWLAGMLSVLLWASPTMADNRFIVRSSLPSDVLEVFCVLQGCSVVGTLDGTLNHVFLLTTPSFVDATTFLEALRNTPGILDAELDELITLVGGLNTVTTPPPGLTDNVPINYFGTTVWNGYARQPASKIVQVHNAQHTFHVAGTGIVADIDTGVDPNHPALKSVLLSGYDFTRNQPGGSEMTDFNSPAPPPCPNCQPAIVNQSTAAVLDQSTAAVLDGNFQYAAFGHGTMVMGVIHLVAPRAQLLPLKAFHSDGTGYLSDVLRAIYYAVQNNANVINMSFDFTTASTELAKALDYANQSNVICVASAGNDGQGPPLLVYPAALQADVMGVASTSDLDTRSTFSNYGDQIVWVAAPGEAIVTTYPFSTYSAGWGTSFSAPFVSGGAALLRSLRSDINQSMAASALANAKYIGPDMGNGRLDLYTALASLPVGSGLQDQ
jgi:Subtilase family